MRSPRRRVKKKRRKRKKCGLEPWYQNLQQMRT
jgi:hypothetical protein